MQAVALVHDLSEHGSALGADPYVLAAAPAISVPSRGERHHVLCVQVVLVVAFQRVAAVAALLKVVERHDGPGARGDRRRALERRVEVPGLAAIPADVARARPLQRVTRLALGAGAYAWEGDEQEARQSKARGGSQSTSL